MPDNVDSGVTAEKSATSRENRGHGAARPEVKVRRLREAALIPGYQTELAAGMDLSACPPDGAPILIRSGEIRMVPIGIAVAIPQGFEGQVRPRSGLASKFGVTLPNSPGTIDADYRGEVIVPLINLGRSDFIVEPGMRVAQMLISPVSHARIRVVDELDHTTRGTGGFGSTG